MALIKTPISLLQEAMAKRAQALPEYEVITRSEMPGPDRFACTVRCIGITAVGFASTKKDAKHAAAKEALSKLGYNAEQRTEILADFIDTNSPFPKTTAIALRDTTSSTQISGPTNVLINKIANVNKIFVNYVGQLNEYVATKRIMGFLKFDYDFDIRTCEFIVRCSLADVVVHGSGVNKKDAKQHAAKLMLQALSEKDLTLGNITPFVRIPLSDACSQKVVEKFKQLSISTKDTDRGTEYCSSISAVKFDEIDNNELPTIEEMEAALKKQNICYSIRTVKKPKIYLAIMTITETKMTHLGCGNTSVAATQDVLKQAIFVAENGFSDTFAP